MCGNHPFGYYVNILLKRHARILIGGQTFVHDMAFLQKKSKDKLVCTYILQRRILYHPSNTRGNHTFFTTWKIFEE